MISNFRKRVSPLGHSFVAPSNLPLTLSLLYHPERSMFLTKEQRLRKRAIKEDRLKIRNDIDATQKVLIERARRDAWAHNADTGAPGDNQGEGASSVKRPRVMASIFGKPARGATSGGRGSVDRGVWIEMPAPFPVYRHATATSPIEVDDDRDGCNAEDGDCRVCLDGEGKGLQLLPEVVSGGLPPLPLMISASGSSCGAEASEREAGVWKDAAAKAAASARRSSRPKSASSTVDDHHGSGTSAMERGSLPSPAAMLFAGPREGFGSACPGSGPAAASLSRELVQDTARPVNDAGDNLEDGDWNGALTVIPRAKRERIMKIAATKRKEDAAADTLWTEVSDEGGKGRAGVFSSREALLVWSGHMVVDVIIIGGFLGVDRRSR